MAASDRGTLQYDESLIIKDTDTNCDQYTR
jgi:hypothetical protein